MSRGLTRTFEMTKCVSVPGRMEVPSSITLGSSFGSWTNTCKCPMLHWLLRISLCLYNIVFKLNTYKCCLSAAHFEQLHNHLSQCITCFNCSHKGCLRSSITLSAALFLVLSLLCTWAQIVLRSIWSTLGVWKTNSFVLICYEVTQQVECPTI